MKLSIITINLNNALGLRKTLDSVANQIYTDMEYLVIDGGSQDESLSIIKRFEQSITSWISEPDHGIYHAMNKGLQQANGEYVLFLNSGDWLVEPEVIQEIFQEPIQEDILIGGCRITQHGKVLHTFRPSGVVTLSWFYRQTIPHQSTFIKKSLFDTYGPYREDLQIHGDYEFWIRTLIRHNCSTRLLPVVVTDYNTDGMSGQESIRALSQREVDQVLAETVPTRILDDYRTWEQERASMQPYYWVRSKPWVHKLFSAFFDLARQFSLFKKRYF